MIMAFIGWCIFGLIIGALARFLMPGRQEMSMVLTIVLGVIGSFAGGAISTLFGAAELGNPSGWIMSLIGALVVLFAYAKLAKS